MDRCGDFPTAPRTMGIRGDSSSAATARHQYQPGSNLYRKPVWHPCSRTRRVRILECQTDEESATILFQIRPHDVYLRRFQAIRGFDATNDRNAGVAPAVTPGLIGAAKQSSIKQPQVAFSPTEIGHPMTITKLGKRFGRRPPDQSK